MNPHSKAVNEVTLQVEAVSGLACKIYKRRFLVEVTNEGFMFSNDDEMDVLGFYDSIANLFEIYKLMLHENSDPVYNNLPATITRRYPCVSHGDKSVKRKSLILPLTPSELKFVRKYIMSYTSTQKRATEMLEETEGSRSTSLAIEHSASNMQPSFGMYARKVMETHIKEFSTHPREVNLRTDLYPNVCALQPCKSEKIDTIIHGIMPGSTIFKCSMILDVIPHFNDPLGSEDELLIDVHTILYRLCRLWVGNDSSAEIIKAFEQKLDEGSSFAFKDESSRFVYNLSQIQYSESQQLKEIAKNSLREILMSLRAQNNGQAMNMIENRIQKIIETVTFHTHISFQAVCRTEISGNVSTFVVADSDTLILEYHSESKTLREVEMEMNMKNSLNSFGHLIYSFPSDMDIHLFVLGFGAIHMFSKAYLLANEMDNSGRNPRIGRKHYAQEMLKQILDKHLEPAESIDMQLQAVHNKMIEQMYADICKRSNILRKPNQTLQSEKERRSFLGIGIVDQSETCEIALKEFIQNMDSKLKYVDVLTEDSQNLDMNYLDSTIPILFPMIISLTTVRIVNDTVLMNSQPQSYKMNYPTTTLTNEHITNQPMHYMPTEVQPPQQMYTQQQQQQPQQQPQQQHQQHQHQQQHQQQQQQEQQHIPHMDGTHVQYHLPTQQYPLTNESLHTYYTQTIPETVTTASNSGSGSGSSSSSGSVGTDIVTSNIMKTTPQPAFMELGPIVSPFVAGNGENHQIYEKSQMLQQPTQHYQNEHNFNAVHSQPNPTQQTASNQFIVNTINSQQQPIHQDRFNLDPVHLQLHSNGTIPQSPMHTLKPINTHIEPLNHNHWQGPPQNTVLTQTLTHK